MSQLLRQSNLLYGSDWKKVFTQFPQINFQASDFNTYREAFIDYIRINYPENFNDWVENSELIFLIDLLAYYGENLTFKAELNAQDNLIDTAETKDSILNLAKLVNYNASRNYPARGLAKITEISTSQELYDSNGRNLQNITIRWNDPSNPDWFEQFILILNNSFNKNNPFGLPVKSGTVGDILSQLYQINSVKFNKICYPFSSNVNNESMNFEVTNPNFNNNEVFFEREPNPNDNFHLIYRNDGGGNSSIDNGFFVYFKQGSLKYSDYNFVNPVKNRKIEINNNNINELDVWVQQINEITGAIEQSWNRVPSTESIVYNSLSNTERNIFSIKTRDNDQITINYPDGVFGNVPVGIFRNWYRISNNKRYTIRPQDIKNVPITIPYKLNVDDNQSYNLTIKFSLQYNIQNSVISEDIEQIKIKAPQNFLMHDNAITGEDYNTFPLLTGNLVRKSKAINRTFAGHSRFIDNLDPTGNYQNTSVFSDDGIIYSQDTEYNNIETLPTQKSAVEIISSKIYPLLQNKDLINLYYKKFPTFDWKYNATKVKWKNISNNTTSSTGLFVDSTNGDAVLNIGSLGVGNAQLIKSGVLMRLVNDPVLTPGQPNYKEIWVNIKNITDYPTITNNIGPVVISKKLDTDETWYVDIFYPLFNTTLSAEEVVSISEQIENKLTFGIRYDYLTSTWQIIDAEDLSTSDFSLTHQGDKTQQNLDASSLIICTYSTVQWNFKSFITEYIFESENDVRFFAYNTSKVFDLENGQPVWDYIKISKLNAIPHTQSALNTDYIWYVTGQVLYNDGYAEPRRIKITMSDSDYDGIPDNPQMFEEVVDTISNPTPSLNSFLFYKREINSNEEYVYIPIDTIIVVQALNDITTDGTYYIIDDDIFKNVINGNVYDTELDEYLVKNGRNSLIFNWKHYASTYNRIDPSTTNINDIYVLTEQYYQDVIKWLNASSNTTFPVSPSTEDLRITFEPFMYKKAASDTIIWHPVKFKLLFGDNAVPELQAKFKIVKSDFTNMSDNEIKYKVIQAINTFFDITNWDFGESFHYTELATYIHQQLQGNIAQVLIVPQYSNFKFGELFQIRCEYNQLFLSTATVNNIDIIDNVTAYNIKIGN